jgi:hypothetical protein
VYTPQWGVPTGGCTLPRTTFHWEVYNLPPPYNPYVHMYEYTYTYTYILHTYTHPYYIDYTHMYTHTPQTPPNTLQGVGKGFTSHLKTAAHIHTRRRLAQLHFTIERQFNCLHSLMPPQIRLDHGVVYVGGNRLILRFGNIGLQVRPSFLLRG